MSARVLVVEDEPDIMLTIRLALQADGYEIVGAGSGEDALAIFAENPPDVTVLDVALPGIDGLEVVRRIRADPRLAAARIIVTSAHVSGDVRRLAQALGCSAYLTKPFSTQELSATLIRVLGASDPPKSSSAR
jgi:two-component system, OmpR family, alkaline phosphatase synthesis response regulator PhoP